MTPPNVKEAVRSLALPTVGKWRTVEVASLAHPWHSIHSGISELTSQDWHLSNLARITFQAETEVTARPEPSRHSPTPARCRQTPIWIPPHLNTSSMQSLALQSASIWPLLPFQPPSRPACNSLHSFLNFSASFHFRAFIEGLTATEMPFLHPYLLKSHHSVEHNSNAISLMKSFGIFKARSDSGLHCDFLNFHLLVHLSP